MGGTTERITSSSHHNPGKEILKTDKGKKKALRKKVEANFEKKWVKLLGKNVKGLGEVKKNKKVFF